MSKGSVRVAVVGLGFGESFIEIYQKHPDVAELMLCDVNAERLDAACARHHVVRRFSSFDELRDSPEVDAVHIVTPTPLHAQHAMAMLRAGKHCACAVPAATTLDELTSLVAEQRASGRNYMMMETAVYAREYLYVKGLVDTGELGHIQLLRGDHFQDMDGWPDYWQGLPPMHYATHAVGPLLALAGTHAASVHCLGSGRTRPELQERYGNPYPAETALFRLAGVDAAAEVTRSLFELARMGGVEAFHVYGSRLGFEWQQVYSEDPVLHRLEPLTPGSHRRITWARVDVPDQCANLPAEIADYARVPRSRDGATMFDIFSHQGGSRPHLVHEFVSSIVEDRAPFPDSVVAAQWTAAGICAHESAMRDGEGLAIPDYLPEV